MATHNIYAIRDLKVGFLPCFTDTNDSVAARNFKFAVNRGNSIYLAEPKDFDLFRVGSFDVETGLLCALDVPVLVCSAVDLAEDFSND